MVYILYSLEIFTASIFDSKKYAKDEATELYNPLNREDNICRTKNNRTLPYEVPLALLTYAGAGPRRAAGGSYTSGVQLQLQGLKRHKFSLAEVASDTDRPSPSRGRDA